MTPWGSGEPKDESYKGRGGGIEIRVLTMAMWRGGNMGHKPPIGQKKGRRLDDFPGKSYSEGMGAGAPLGAKKAHHKPHRALKFAPGERVPPPWVRRRRRSGGGRGPPSGPFWQPPPASDALSPSESLSPSNSVPPSPSKTPPPLRWPKKLRGTQSGLSGHHRHRDRLWCACPNHITLPRDRFRGTEGSEIGGYDKMKGGKWVIGRSRGGEPGGLD